MKKIYVSIPISGFAEEEVRARAKAVKRRLSADGVEVMTPFDVCPEKGLPYSAYMGKDIEAMLECDVVYMCQEWQNSKGCMAEFEVARIYGKLIIFE